MVTLRLSSLHAGAGKALPAIAPEFPVTGATEKSVGSQVRWGEGFMECRRGGLLVLGANGRMPIRPLRGVTPWSPSGRAARTVDGSGARALEMTVESRVAASHDKSGFQRPSLEYCDSWLGAGNEDGLKRVRKPDDGPVGGGIELEAVLLVVHSQGAVTEQAVQLRGEAISKSRKGLPREV